MVHVGVLSKDSIALQNQEFAARLNNGPHKPPGRDSTLESAVMHLAIEPGVDLKGEPKPWREETSSSS
jgi:hypothetical protein